MTTTEPPPRVLLVHATPPDAVLGDNDAAAAWVNQQTARVVPAHQRVEDLLVEALDAFQFQVRVWGRLVEDPTVMPHLWDGDQA